MDKHQNILYISQILTIDAVDKNVDNPDSSVDGLWISDELSTGWSYPQNYPQVYPQILPLLSTGLSTSRMTIYSFNNSEYSPVRSVIHKPALLSTETVDNSLKLWIDFGSLSTVSRRVVDRLLISRELYALKSLQCCFPGGKGKKKITACS